MSKHRRYLGLLLFTLVVLTSSVFLLSNVAYAQDIPKPLKYNDQIIQKQSQIIEEKTTVLQTTSQEIQDLEDKKQALAQQLELEKQTISDLTQKLAEKKAAAEAERKRVEELKNMFVYVNNYAFNSSGNSYTPGNCTWYVKNRRPDLPNNLGNANMWYSNAAAMGWNVGLTPKKGAAATTGYGWVGHVAYVEGVSLDGLWVTISEMNYGGLYNMNTQTVYYTTFRYIYELN